MQTLELYKNLGFKFILCKADKTPDVIGSDSWHDDYNHLTIQQAKTYQQTGRMIGAIIPPSVCVLNLNRRAGQPDGIKEMQYVKEKYNIQKSLRETLIVSTPGNGHHLYYTLPENMAFIGGIKAPGVELKTHSENNGYVIIADSPGYKIFSDEIVELFPELILWLKDCEQSDNEKPTVTTDDIKKALLENGVWESGIPETDQCNDKQQEKKLPPRALKRILNKIEPSNFAESDKWHSFARSCIAVSGNSIEVKSIIFEWLNKNEILSQDEALSAKINEIDDPGKVTVGSFIHYLRDCNLSQYIINQVVKLDSISNTLIDAENSEVQLPFCDPDYSMIALAPAAKEFFQVQGNTAAASILEMAMENKVLYSDSEKTPFYFDGNRWIEFNDYFGIIYTIIFRVVKIIYAESEGDKEDNDRMFKCVQALNSTHWKMMTWKELCNKDLIFRKTIDWDSPKIVETITTIDGVIDFTSGEMKPRNGEYHEYRKSYFGYSTDEVMNAETPATFIDFFDSLFPDEETRDTAKYCVSMAISGNAGKRLFQLWQGIGSNGKSTLLETIRNVLGKEKSYKFPADILLTGAKRENYKAEIAKFQGKYFCYSSEAEKGARLSQNIIKDMTGDEAISARELYKSPIEFEATWQIIYAVNDLPAIYGDDYAFNDRLIVIPFKMFFYKDDEKKKMAVRRGVDEKYLSRANSSKKFKQGLYLEKAGIVKWMIENYNNLNNTLGGVIPESLECKQKKTAYIEDNDDIGVFLSEICEIDETGEKGWYMLLEDLADEFREFTGSQKKGTKSIIRDIVESHSCIERGVRRVATGERDYEGSLRMKQTRVLENIRLRSVTGDSGAEKKESGKTEQEIDDEAIAKLFG